MVKGLRSRLAENGFVEVSQAVGTRKS